MRTKVVSEFITGILCLAIGASAQAATSVKDGVFSDAQAERGQGVILDACARCHSSTLLGGESSPPLVGQEFWSKWKNGSLGDLFEKIQTTMPTDGPGKLRRSEYIAALAYILRANNFPSGEKPLPSDINVLSQIQMGP